MIDKNHLKQLIDELPEAEAGAVRDFVEFLGERALRRARGAATAALEAVPVDDAPETAAGAAMVQAARSALMVPVTMFYGDRHGGVQDPMRNTWWIATHVEDVSPEEVERRVVQST